IARHRAEEAAGRRARRYPGRDRGAAGAELDEGGGEGLEQLVLVEQADHVRLAEEEKALGFAHGVGAATPCSGRAACWPEVPLPAGSWAGSGFGPSSSSHASVGSAGWGAAGGAGGESGRGPPCARLRAAP